MNRAQVGSARTAACVAAFVGVSAFWIAHAQQNTDAARFTGVSRALEAEGWRLSRRSFEPGARTAWHRHGGGQLLFVESGRARVQERGGTLRELATAESYYTAPNVEHWHGATLDVEFRQVALSRGDASETVWLEHVTDAQYQGR
ncbi:MAG TPA: cupin domain-containing protein [Gammaproteobacteria bacterium]|nr:cupin domain-containing protein [Gammaproteobacteria bacterium]